MAVYHPTRVTCSCGASFEASLARSVNAARFPEARKSILAGTFHRAVCPTCGGQFAIERPFWYSDASRGSLFSVQPRGQRHAHARDSNRLDVAHEMLPISDPPVTRRVVYGLDELREKLVAQDAKLDDRVVELLKILLLHEHPFLLKEPRLQMFLTASEPHRLAFTAYYHNKPRSFEIALPRGIVDDLVSREPELRAWANKHKAAPLFNLPDSWVNFRRWTTRYRSLATLRALAGRIREGQAVDLASNAFTTMVKWLPRGSQLPAWAKKDLRVVFDYAKAQHKDKVEDALFEIRFGVELDDEWALNSNPDDIDTIWQLLRDVPVTNIEGNTSLHEIQLMAGGGGLYQWSGIIQIGENELGDRERFEDTLRHEVGHAVHAQRDGVVTPWLGETFGWRLHRADAQGVDAWIAAMGGWGGLTAQQRTDVTQALLSAIGPGSSWQPGPAPSLPAGHPWHAADFGPRLAFEKTGAYWFQNFASWHRANGKAFFMNYWYRQFMIVNDAALTEFVAKMPSSYASMSHFEFFAELYALYYDKDDPLRSVISADVARWFDDNIGVRSANNPRVPGAPRGGRR